MKKFIKALSVALSIFSLASLSTGIVYSNALPNSYQVIKGEELSIKTKFSITVDAANKVDTVSENQNSISGEEYEAQLKLFGIIPIKTVKVDVIDEMYVVPSGKTFGIKIFTNGVMVVGMTEVDGDNGLSNPAKNAGIKIGDVIILINGKSVSSNTDVANIIENSKGKSVEVVLMRNKKELKISFKAVKSSIENKYKAGLWVRDSSAGIGTLTFYSPTTGVFGGLGHAVCDVDTGLLLPLQSGEILGAKINSINKGIKGKAGEICGNFTNEKLGKLFQNCEVGVYGVLDSPTSSKNLIKVALKQEVKTGKAQILTSIDNNGPKYFDCVVEKVKYNDQSLTQNIIIRVTDDELLQKTGGIIQGMSGSPIIQNNKLIGAVTHVFVNNPDKGYAIFAENMFNESKNVWKAYQKAS